MITHIKIAGYKSIESLTLDLQPINILLGGNGVGKSNFISLFSLVRNLYNKNLQHYILKKGGSDRLLHFGKKHTSHIRLTVYFKSDSDDENKFIVDLEAGREHLFIQSIKTAFNVSGNYTSAQVYDRNVLESGFKDVTTGQAFWVNQRLKEFDVYHFHDTSDTSPMKGMADIHDNYRLKGDGSNLAAFLFYLKKKSLRYSSESSRQYNRLRRFLGASILNQTGSIIKKFSLNGTKKAFRIPTSMRITYRTVRSGLSVWLLY